jgi:WD40 repeat protein
MIKHRVPWRATLLLSGSILATHALMTAGPRLVRTRTIGQPVTSKIRGIRWEPVVSVAWSPDGKQLAASGGPGYGVRIWNSATAEEDQVLLDPTDSALKVACYRAAWSPDGTRIASLALTDSSQPIRIWSRPAGRQHHRLNRPVPTTPWGICDSVAWSPNGAWIATTWSATGVQITDARSGQIVLGIHRGTFGAAWSPNSQQLAWRDRQAVHIWDVLGGRELRRLDHPNVVDLAWSPDGKRLATASDRGSVRVWDVTTGQQSWDRTYRETPSDESPIVYMLSVYVPRITCIAWSPTGRLLATTGADGDVCLWNASNGREKLRLHGGSLATGLAVAWSPDGRRVAAGGMDGRVWVWDLAP